MRKLAALVAVAALVMLAACGGGRPSTSEVASGLTKSMNTQVPAELAEMLPQEIMDNLVDCMADVLVSSKVSDEMLQAVADGKMETYEVSDKDEEHEDAVAKEWEEKCVSKYLDPETLMKELDLEQ